MITIVSAFFDIGRANWSAYSRSVDTYFKNFSRLCALENDVVLFTESRHRERLEALQRSKPNLTVYYQDDLFERHAPMLARIEQIQQSESFREGIQDPSCPEYNSPKYVLINYLKSRFCVEAIERLQLSCPRVAWIDFGYLRKNRQLPVSLRWDYPFEDKIHLFSLKPYGADVDIVHAIKHNTVFIQGCHIVASRQKWALMAELMEQAYHSLEQRDLIDDDQTLLLMASLSAPEQFVVRPALIEAKLDWFFIFRRYNRFEQELSLLDRLKFAVRKLGLP
ncbi:hypothetical protein DBR47_03255 [Paucibacter sp. KBW04]|uniref:WlaTC/HtrL family glycosyltransferase n=1 Tax=Paucibacter sp. KBW04 TaxID=2153361 RepID=UPI000F57DBC9|nr:WlaTC/HtrL family glycosyltransferase [Paucibacter sp. KBW04]RQO63557.1 hypothetical protein DBR47_03255 [Paucibacter sp. KBW04]